MQIKFRKMEKEQMLNASQMEQNVQTMRNIIYNLRQSELNNANLTQNLFHEEVTEAADLNRNIGNVPEMARRDKRAADVLQQVTGAENHAIQQLDLLDKMLTELQGQLR